MSDLSLQDTIDRVDDVAAYIARTSPVQSKWILSDFNTDRILSDDFYNQYSGSDKKFFIRYFVFGFLELSKFFAVESDIRNRSKSFNFKFFIINLNQANRECKAIFFKEEDWKKLDIKSSTLNINKKGWDILLEDDVKVEKDEFDVLYEDDEILAIKPKTYRAAIKYSADSSWKASLKKNKEWIEKLMTPGSYYGGINWYTSKTIKKEVETWWTKLLRLPPKKSEVELKQFFSDFPRYLFYIVIFKKLGFEDDMSKLYLLFDVNRSEYGELPQAFSSSYVLNGYWGDMLDASHNQLKIVNNISRRTSLRDIHDKHGQLFNRAFREIEYDFNNEKDKMYDLLGFWAEKGGEYRDDALVFIRDKSNRLQITRPSLIEKSKDNKTISWRRLGYYDDDEFDYWNLDDEKSIDKPIPNGGQGFKNYFMNISDTKNLMDLIDDIDDEN